MFRMVYLVLIFNYNLDYEIEKKRCLLTTHNDSINDYYMIQKIVTNIV